MYRSIILQFVMIDLIMAKRIMKSIEHKGNAIEAWNFGDLTRAPEEEMSMIPSPGIAELILTMPRDFNLIFQTNIGVMSDGSSVAYASFPCT